LFRKDLVINLVGNNLLQSIVVYCCLKSWNRSEHQL